VSARRLGQDEQYLTVREILSEVSTLADGALSRERSDSCRFGYATLGFVHWLNVHLLQFQTFIRVSETWSFGQSLYDV